MSWIGIDTGGTFTDLVLVDTRTGECHFHKLPTTRENASIGILQGVEELLEIAGSGVGDVAMLVHGTTLATNAVLERRWARTGLLTTQGFRDVLELARQRRPAFYNLDVAKPASPAAREDRLEIAERLAFDGSVVTPLDEAELVDAADRLREAGVEAVAICFLHAYSNPDHEQSAKALINERWPEAYVCSSSEVSAEYREYERFAATTVNASLMPVIGSYLDHLERGAVERGVHAQLRVMQSNGGAVSVPVIRRMPINTFFSGPAGGVIGAAAVGKAAGLRNVIAFDMGGTSTDVSLIRDGVAVMKSQGTVGGFPASTRTIDIHSIGTGGGSIAWVDPGGLLKLGPRSAGAFPGPAAYGRGGTEPTITDANVVLGRLSPKKLLGGRMSMYPERAHAAISGLAKEIGTDPVTAAAGIVEIGNVGMMGAVRVITVEQGHDPRDSALVAFGGAGPLHAVEVSALLGIPTVSVPARPGLLSAIGLLHADTRGDFSLTRPLRVEAGSLALLRRGLDELQQRGEAWLEQEGRGIDEAEFKWSADVRYVGQNYELPVQMASRTADEEALAQLTRGFEAHHQGAYGYVIEGQQLELVTLRLVVVVRLKSPGFKLEAPGDRTLAKALSETRDVWFAQTGFVPTQVYDREALPRDATVQGPAIFEQMDTTTVLPPGCEACSDEHGSIVITLE